MLMCVSLIGHVVYNYISCLDFFIYHEMTSEFSMAFFGLGRLKIFISEKKNDKNII